MNLLSQQYRPSADIMKSYTGALQATGMRNALLNQPIQQAREAERFQWDREDRERLRQLDPIVKLTSFTNFVRQQAPNIRWQNYPQAREYLSGIADDLGIPNLTFPTPDEIAQEAMNKGMMPEQYFEQWKNSSLRTAESRIDEMTAQAKARTAQTGLIKALEPKTPTTAMAAFLKQKPNATPDEIALFAQKLKGKGISLTLPDGTTVQIGGAAGGELTAKTRGALEEKVTSGRELVARIEAITNEFKPEYQEIGTRLGAAWTGIKARLGMDISPEDTKLLSDFKKYQRKSIENINLYIKEMTGAQMSEREAKRLRLAMPDPGESWWQGDDPITFKAKMEDVMVMTRAAVARFEHYRSEGLSDTEIKSLINTDKAVSLEQFVDSEKAKTLQQRGDELFKQGLSKAEVLKTLRSEGY